MPTAARESRYKLKGSFGEETWKVALEPGRRTGNDMRFCDTECRKNADYAVGVHARSPLSDH